MKFIIVKKGISNYKKGDKVEIVRDYDNKLITRGGNLCAERLKDRARQYIGFDCLKCRSNKIKKL